MKVKSTIDKLEVIFKQQKKLQTDYLRLQKILHDSKLKNDASLLQVCEQLIEAKEDSKNIAFYLFIQQVMIQVEAAIRQEQSQGE
jgi:hypothetical protein